MANGPESGKRRGRCGVGVGVRAGGVMLAGAVIGAVSVPALAGPEGERVKSGSATFHRNGSHTTIRTGQNTIINYDSFNLRAHESVRFAQPNSSSRVLNRITGADPSFLNGTITANGTVYFVNPAGVYFGPNSVINVGSIYAAAGHISNKDFLRGRDRFTDVTGEVVNEGVIRAQYEAHLVGSRIVNSGSVVSTDGMVTFSAGEDVLIGRRGGNVFARITPTAAESGGPSIENSGTIDAGRGGVMLGAGDYASLALMDTSVVRGGDVRIDAGAHGSAEVSGVVSARNRGGENHATREGGRVDILGGAVSLEGATIDASGTFGGGEINIGGGFQGKGDLRRSETTDIDAASRVRADALRRGDGGEAVIWSDGVTTFDGFVSARGGRYGGSGGFAEVSGKLTLDLSPASGVDLRAPMGPSGELLLDPFAIEVIATGGSATVQSDVDGFGGPATTIDRATLLSFLNMGDVTLRADDSITFSATIPYFGTSSLTLEAGRLVEIAAARALVVGGGIRIDVGAAGAIPGPGDGGFIMGDGSAIATTRGDLRIDVRNLPGGRGSIEISRVLSLGVGKTVYLSNADVDGLGISVTPGATANLIYGDNFVFRTLSGDAGGAAAGERLRLFDAHPGDGVAPVLSGEIAGGGFFELNDGTAFEVGETPAVVFGRANRAADGLVTGGDAHFRIGQRATLDVSRPLAAGENLVFDVGAFNAQLGEAADGAGDDFEFTTAQLTDSNVTFSGLTILGGPGSTVRIDDNAAGDIFAKLAGLDLTIGDAAARVGGVFIDSAAGGELALNDFGVYTNATLRLRPGITGVRTDGRLDVVADGGVVAELGSGVFTFTGGAGGLSIDGPLTTITDVDFFLNGVDPELGPITAFGSVVNFFTDGLLRVGSGAGSGMAATTISSAIVAGITADRIGFTSSASGVEFADDGGALTAGFVGDDVLARGVGGAVNFFGDGAGTVYAFGALEAVSAGAISFGPGVTGLSTDGALTLDADGGNRAISFAEGFALRAGGGGVLSASRLDAGANGLTLGGPLELRTAGGANGRVVASALTIENGGALTLGGGATLLELDIDDLELIGTGGIDAGAAGTLRLVTGEDVEFGRVTAIAGDGLEIGSAEFRNLTFGTLDVRTPGGVVSILDNAAGDVFATLTGRSLLVGRAAERVASFSAASDAGGATLETSELSVFTDGDVVLGEGLAGINGAVTLDLASGALRVLDPLGLTFNIGGAGSLALTVSEDHTAAGDDGDIRARGGVAFGGATAFTGVEKISTGLAAGDNNGGLAFDGAVTVDGRSLLMLVDGAFTMGAGGSVSGLPAGGFFDVTANAFTLDAAAGSIAFASDGLLAFRGPSLIAQPGMPTIGANVGKLILEATDVGGVGTDLRLVDMQSSFSGFTGETCLVAGRDVLFEATAANALYTFGGPLDIDAGRDLSFEMNVSGIRSLANGLRLDPGRQINLRGSNTITGEFRFVADNGIAGDFLDVHVLAPVFGDPGVAINFSSPAQIEEDIFAGNDLTFRGMTRLFGDLTIENGRFRTDRSLTLADDVTITLAGATAGETVILQGPVVAEANQNLTINMGSGVTAFAREVGDTGSAAVTAGDLGLIRFTGDGFAVMLADVDARAFEWTGGGLLQIHERLRLSGQIDAGVDLDSMRFGGTQLRLNGGEIQTVGAGSGNVTIDALVASSVGEDVLINVDVNDDVLDLVGGGARRGLLTINGNIVGDQNVDLRADQIVLNGDTRADAGGVRLRGTAGVDGAVSITGDVTATSAFDAGDPASRSVIVSGDARLDGDVRSTRDGDAVFFDSRLRFTGDHSIVTNRGDIELNDVVSLGGTLFARTDNGDGTASGGDITLRDAAAADAAAGLNSGLRAFTDGGTITVRNIGGDGADAAAGMAGLNGLFELTLLELDAGAGTIRLTGTHHDAASMSFSAGAFAFDTDPTLAVDPVLGRIVTFGDARGTTRTERIAFSGGTLDMAGLDLLVFNALGQNSADASHVVSLTRLADSDGMTGGGADALRIRANAVVSLMGSDAGSPLGDVFIATEDLMTNGADLFAATIRLRPFDDSTAITLGDGVPASGMTLTMAEVMNLRGGELFFGAFEPDPINDYTAVLGAYTGRITLGDVTLPAKTTFQTALAAVDAIRVAGTRTVIGTAGLTFDGLLTVGGGASVLGGGSFVEALEAATLRNNAAVDSQGGRVTFADAVDVGRAVRVASGGGAVTIEGATNAITGIGDAGLTIDATGATDGVVELFTVGNRDRLGTLSVTGRRIAFDGSAYRTAGAQMFTATGNGGSAVYDLTPAGGAVAFDTLTGAMMFDDAAGAALRLNGSGVFSFDAGSAAGFNPGAGFMGPAITAGAGFAPVLEITADGLASVSGPIGTAARPMASVTITGATLDLNGATTSGSQIYTATGAGAFDDDIRTAGIFAAGDGRRLTFDGRVLLAGVTRATATDGVISIGGLAEEGGPSRFVADAGAGRVTFRGTEYAGNDQRYLAGSYELTGGTTFETTAAGGLVRLGPGGAIALGGNDLSVLDGFGGSTITLAPIATTGGETVLVSAPGTVNINGVAGPGLATLDTRANLLNTSGTFDAREVLLRTFAGRDISVGDRIGGTLHVSRGLLNGLRPGPAGTPTLQIGDGAYADRITTANATFGRDTRLVAGGLGGLVDLLGPVFSANGGSIAAIADGVRLRGPMSASAGDAFDVTLDADGPVLIDGNAAVNTAGGDFTTADVDGIGFGRGDLLVDTGAGTLTIGQIGVGSRVASATLRTDGVLTLTDVRSTGDQLFDAGRVDLPGGMLLAGGGSAITFEAPVRVLGGVDVLVAGPGGAIAFNEIITGTAAAGETLVAGVDAGGLVTLNGVGTASAADQIETLDVNGSSDLFGDVLVSQRVTLNGDADARAAELTISAPVVEILDGLDAPDTRTDVLVNAIDRLLLEGDSGDAGALGDFAVSQSGGQTEFDGTLTSVGNVFFGHETLARGSVTTAGRIGFAEALRVMDELRLESTAATFDAGIRFRGTVNGDGVGSMNDRLVAITNRSVGGELITGGGLNADVPVISFSENVGQTDALGLLDLNFDPGSGIDGRAFTPANATIVFGDADSPVFGGRSYEVAAGAMRMGARETLLSLGGFTFTGSGPVATRLSDISALGDLVIDAPSVEILAREAGPKLDGSTGAIVEDAGVDFVASGTITIGTITSVVPLVAGANDPEFGLPSGDAQIDSTAGLFLSKAIEGELAPVAGAPGPGRTVLLDLRADGPTNTNVSEVIAGATAQDPELAAVDADATIDAATRNALDTLGVPVAEEERDRPEGDPAAVIDNLEYDEASLDPRYGVTSRRLDRETVAAIVAEYDRLLFVTIGAGEAEGARRSRVEQIQLLIETTVNQAYEDDGVLAIIGEDVLTGPALADFLRREPTPEAAELRGLVVELRRIVRDIERLGLSESEYEQVRSQGIVQRSLISRANQALPTDEWLVLLEDDAIDLGAGGGDEPADRPIEDPAEQPVALPDRDPAQPLIEN